MLDNNKEKKTNRGNDASLLRRCITIKSRIHCAIYHLPYMAKCETDEHKDLQRWKEDVSMAKPFN